MYSGTQAAGMHTFAGAHGGAYPPQPCHYNLRGREEEGWTGKKKKKGDGFEAAGADRRDEAYWHLQRKGCVRSPTGFIMTGPCEGGQEPFSEPRSRYSRKLLNKISAFWGVATKDQHFFFGLKTAPVAAGGRRRERRRWHLARVEGQLSYTHKHMREQQRYWNLAVRKVKRRNDYLCGCLGLERF